MSTNEKESNSNSRAFEHAQALASARIEGFEPSAEFAADYDDLAKGVISAEEFRARVEVRARRLESALAAAREAGDAAP